MSVTLIYYNYLFVYYYIQCIIYLTLYNIEKLCALRLPPRSYYPHMIKKIYNLLEIYYGTLFVMW
jgi:hypothetical protein